MIYRCRIYHVHIRYMFPWHIILYIYIHIRDSYWIALLFIMKASIQANPRQVLFASHQTLQLDLEILRGRLAEAEATAELWAIEDGTCWMVLSSKKGRCSMGISRENMVEYSGLCSGIWISEDDWSINLIISFLSKLTRPFQAGCSREDEETMALEVREDQAAGERWRKARSESPTCLNLVG